MRRLLRAIPVGLVVVLFAQQGAMAATTGHVKIYNLAFSPVAIPMHIGDSVEWLNQEANFTHTSTSDGFDACCPNGPALWESPPLDKGQTFTQLFSAAGRFNYHCSIHTYMFGSVYVLGTASPRQGNITTVFTIAWAAAPGVPTGFTEDIQIKRPGSTHWVMWKGAQAAGTTSVTFTPDTGVGIYRFRARLTNTSLGTSSGWTAAWLIQVS